MGPGGRGCPPEKWGRGCPPGRWPADVPASAHLFVESAAGLADTLDVGGEDGHHLARVLRLRVGEPVTVADGSGAWRPYRVGAVGGVGRDGGGGASGAVVRLDATGVPDREPAAPWALAVAFALTKGDKPELAVQKLTELGVDRILPVVAERSVARPDPARATAALERWRRISMEAARQCRRAALPVIEPLAPLASLSGHRGLVVAERGGPPAEALVPPPAAEILAVVGPEGGLSPDEVEALAPWARLGLGPHILRAETAALAAAMVLNALRRPAAS